ncbi:hypothetical protein [Algibacter sp. L4_22]|uniref:YobI family P-loop NTPase n=1 Tax=Algibacter sp. L4_22 TaxID=2942477 RepID=UPI00201B672E|nr:hypothetical protein [Algibacter sp. L4_22]MCL5127786.1 hypothetical protein [Algibacter sp. L4_22]
MSEKKKEETKVNIVRSLAPKIIKDAKELKRIKPYLDSLKSGIEAKGVTNIAVTGDYGSGKSTVLATFQDRNQNYEYINVSLASFKEEDKTPFNSVDDKGKLKKILDIDRLLELSILQQIFYHVEPKEIPDSRFKRIKSISNKKLKAFALGSVIWLVSFAVLFIYEGLEKFLT